MRKTLMTTVAVATVVGFTTLAWAQAPTGADKDKGASKSEGVRQEQKATPGGAMMHQQGGAQSTEKTLGKEGGQAAQGAKPDDRMGQGTQDQNKAATQKGAQEQRSVKERGAQEERGMKERGAQEERGMKERGAQEERGMKKRGAQEERGLKERTQEVGKSGISSSEQRLSGKSVQLSQDQRTRVHAIIGKSSTARASTDEHFNVSVGAKVPRSVHFEVLPEEIVEIVPEFRGFDYVLIGDEILIIDPDTLEIVAIISA
jgi:Protein of unknown function (DUF1236)